MARAGSRGQDGTTTTSPDALSPVHDERALTMLTPDAGMMGAHHLVDAHGSRLGWTVLDADRRRAEPLWRAPDVPAGELARLVSSDLAGTRIATDDAELAQALRDRGGTTVRYATMMVARPVTHVPSHSAPTHHLGPLPRTPEGIEAVASQLAPLRLAAHPRAHPDHDPDDSTNATTARLKALLAGDVLGPLAGELSAIVHGRDQDPLGAIIVTMPEADAIWSGGPWVADLFVDPRHSRQGLGRRLLQHTLNRCVVHRHPQVGLAVTMSNPAVELYRSLGFADTFTSWTIDVPPDDHPAFLR